MSDTVDKLKARIKYLEDENAVLATRAKDAWRLHIYWEREAQRCWNMLRGMLQLPPFDPRTEHVMSTNNRLRHFVEAALEELGKMSNRRHYAEIDRYIAERDALLAQAQEAQDHD